MKKTIIFIYLIICITVSISVAQQRRIHKMDGNTRHKIAHYQVQRGSYYGAIDILEQLCKQHPNNPKYEFKLAESYFKARDYQKAETLFKHIYDKEQLSGKTSLATFHYGETLKYLGKYDSAKIIFEQYANAKRYDGKDAPRMKSFANAEIAACEFANKLAKDTNQEYTAIPLSRVINRGYSDFAPRLKDDKTLIFTSLQEDSLVKYKYGEKHFKHHKIYQARLSDTLWSEPREIPEVNTYFESNGNGIFSPDGKRFYFTRCSENSKQDMICHIYVSEVENGNLQKPKKLEGNINMLTSTSTQPFITKMKQGKGEVEVMYFVSNRKGSMGGSLDIWYAVWDNKKKMFARPQSCGRSVNTMGDEISPYYVLEDSTLYFSSDYHAGLGGYDVFKIRGAGNKWQDAPVNVGKGINSSYDDMFYTPAKIHPEIQGFLVSNRPGAVSMRGNITCCDDIFRLRPFRPEDKISTIPQKAIDTTFEDTSQEIVQEEIPKDDVPTPQEQTIVEPTPQPTIQHQQLTEVVKEQEPVQTIVIPAPTPKEQPKKSMMILEMKNKINFENAKVNLDEDDEPALKEIIDYLNIYPGLVVEVGGHTDSNGSDEMNRILSIQRATSVVNTLVNKYNVPKRRLKIKGYGESMPIADNNTLEGKILNRRVEFKALQWE